MSLSSAFREEWTSWFDQFSVDNRDLNGSLVIIDASGKVQIIAEGLAFKGLSADLKDGEDAIIISLDSLNHIVSNVTELDLEETEALPAAVRLKSSDGTTHLLHLS